MSKPVVLLDCDGVLADFTGAYLDLVCEFTGHIADHADVTRWKLSECDFFRVASLKSDIPERRLKEMVDEAITDRDHFCRDLKPLPGAAAAVARLQEVANVYVVTSPWHSSPAWAHERTKWLAKHMNVARDRVVQCSDKRVVHGHVLVDDKPSNLAHWRHGLGLLWDAPWNRDTASTLDAPRRVFVWEDVENFVKSLQ